MLKEVEHIEQYTCHNDIRHVICSNQMREGLILKTGDI